MVSSVSTRSFGFTLIELMVTVAVLAIVTAVAIPSFMSVINANRLQGPASEVLAAMNFARSEAIRQNRTILVCKANTSLTACDNTTGRWPALLVFSPEIGNQPAEVLRTVSFDAQLVTTSTSPVIRFTSQGFIRNATNQPLSGALRICIVAEKPLDNARDLNFVSGGRINTAKKALSGICPAIN